MCEDVARDWRDSVDVRDECIAYVRDDIAREYARVFPVSAVVECGGRRPSARRRCAATRNGGRTQARRRRATEGNNSE